MFSFDVLFAVNNVDVLTLLTSSNYCLLHFCPSFLPLFQQSSKFSNTFDSQQEGGGFKSPWGQGLFWAKFASCLRGFFPSSSPKHASICYK